MTTFSITCPAPCKYLKGPVIANFPTGPLNPEKSDSVKVVEYEVDKGDIKSKVLVAQTEKLDLIGTSSPAPTDPVYCVARVNRKTGKVYVYDAVKYNLQPQSSDAGQDQKEELSYSEKLDHLTESFGTYKKLCNMLTRRRNRRQDGVENVVKSAVSETLSKLPTDSPSDLASQHHAQAMPEIPPCFIHAETPAEAYKLEDIISEDNIRDLEPLAMELASTAEKATIIKWAEEEKYPPYILEQLEQLPIGETERIHRCCSLLYLHYLICLFEARPGALRTGDYLPSDIPDSVKQILKSEFILHVYQPGRKPKPCMPTRLKDKALSYIIVLAMIIDEFNVNMDLLIPSLKLNLLTLTKHVRAVGGKMSVSTINGMARARASLPIPITFPDVKMKPKRKAR